MEELLLWLIRLAAIATLVPSFFVLWYLAGSDDRPRNFVAPILGFGVMIAAVWTVVGSFGSLVNDPMRVLLISSLAPSLCLFAWPFSGTRATGRDSLLAYLPAVVWLLGPPLLTLLYLALR